MSTAAPTAGLQTPTINRTTDYPQGGLRFDWAFTGLASLFIAGLWVDGWAHFHGQVDQSFFTPWHFLFYSSFGLIAIFVAVNHWRNVARGYDFRRALPEGYWYAVIGVMVFAVGGVGDMIWHTLFGIEGGSEALTSPTHIILVIGMVLIITSPLRAAWKRYRQREVPGWLTLVPALIAATLFLSLLAFFTTYAHPLMYPAAARILARGGGSMTQDAGVTSILLQSAFIAGVVGLLTVRWRLPFGTFTLLLTLSSFLITILSDMFFLMPGAVLTGLVVDVVYWRLNPLPDNPIRFHLFAFLVPALYYAFYFASIKEKGGIGWSIHVWTGSIVLAGIVGLLISYLIIASYKTESTSTP